MVPSKGVADVCLEEVVERQIFSDRICDLDYCLKPTFLAAILVGLSHCPRPKRRRGNVQVARCLSDSVCGNLARVTIPVETETMFRECQRRALPPRMVLPSGASYHRATAHWVLYLCQRVRAAFRAIAFRFLGVSAFARAFPPF